MKSSVVRHHTSVRWMVFCLALFVAGGAHGSEVEEAKESEPKTLVVLGDSIAAGQGVLREEAFPALLEQKLREAGMNWKVANAGVSGDTTASGSRRIQWVLKQKADALLIELGGNDGLRGIPPKTTKENLISIIDQARETRPGISIVLAKMRMPSNMGARYTSEFEKVYDEVGKSRDVALTPFLLEGIGGDPAFNQPDLIHPTAEGHRKVVETILPTITRVLQGQEVEAERP